MTPVDRNSRSLHRRRFLKSCLSGTGLSLALPWLESVDSAESASAESSETGPPTRFGCFFFSNGVEPAHWWAKQNGKGQNGKGQNGKGQNGKGQNGEGPSRHGVQYGPGLAPLQRHCDDITFVKGLVNEQAALHPSPHMGRMANLLSGAWISQDQTEIRAGQSMDQVLAKSIGRRTALPSLAVGVEPTELRLEDGLSMIYGSCISWSTDTKPATKEIYPARVYDLIVGNRGDRKLDRSILDAAVSDAADLKRKLSAGDQVKLDEYFESIRDIETRIDHAKKNESLEGWRPSLDQPTFGRPDENLPQDVSAHMRLMLDLIILAFQMDKTRIATCMLNNDLSQMNFGFLEGVQGSLHLDLTHNGRDPELEAMYLKTNQFHAGQFGYLIDRMKNIQEGNATLLDNTILMFCSNLFDGDKHQADEMPVLLAGGGAGMSRKRIVDVGDRPIDDRRACNLYLSIMDRMGAPLPSFGDSTGQFEALS